MTDTIDPGAPTGRETIPVSIRMPQSLLDQLDAMASHRSTSRASLIVKIVENMLRIRDRGIVPDADGNSVKIQPPCEHYGTGLYCGICGAKR